jgi:hypothetical protein
MGFPPILSLLVPACALDDAPRLVTRAASLRSSTLSYHSCKSATAARRLVPVIFGAGWLDR